MLFDGIKLVEGSEVQNLVVDTGSVFPGSPNDGELFFVDDDSDGNDVGLYVYSDGNWKRQLQSGDDIGDILSDIITPGTFKSVTVSSKGLVTAGSNPTTLSGYGITDAQPLDADLTAIGAISATSGLLRKTAANTWSLDTSTFLTANQSITLSGDAAGSGTTSIAVTLANSGVAAGAYGTASSVPTISIDSKGRVYSASNTSIAIAASAVTSGTFDNNRISASSVTQHQASLTIAESQITDGSILARLAASETVSGSWTFSNAITQNTAPTNATHVATKQYVDNVASGMNVHLACRAATNAALTATYDNGTAGVGATLTGTGALPTIDGVTLTDGDRVLVKNQSDQKQNGIYVVTKTTANWELTRADDFDNSPTGEIIAGDSTFVQEGSQATTQWVQVTTGSISIGTSNLVFTQFGGPGSYVGGTGINVSSNTISNTGVTSAVAGTGIGVSGATGAVTITNNGVTSLVAGTNIGISASTGAVTVSVSGTVASATSATTATNVAGGAANSLVYQTGSGATSFIATGTGVLAASGGLPAYTTTPTLTGTNFSAIPNSALTNSSITVTAGTGMSGGGSVSLGGSVTLNNAGVTSLAGTASQVSVSAATGSITISLPSTLVAPGSVEATTFVKHSVQTGISAAGSNQGTATVLTKQINYVATTGSGQGVLLPNSVGTMFVVANYGANTLSVYPTSGAQIDSLAANAAFALPVGGKIMFIQVSSGVYLTLNATYA